MENESLTTLMNFAGDITLDIKQRARMYVQVMNQINRHRRLKMQMARLKAKQQEKPERRGVYKFGNYILNFPTRGDRQLTPEEAKKEREEIVENINREYNRLYLKPDEPLKTIDNE